jgi:hypothetical protein
MLLIISISSSINRSSISTINSISIGSISITSSNSETVHSHTNTFDCDALTNPRRPTTMSDVCRGYYLGRLSFMR